MLPRPATFIDLAIAAQGQTVRECAEATGLSASGLSNLVLGTRFPQNVDAFIARVVPYLESLAPEGANPEGIRGILELQLRRAHAVEAQLRALFENSLAAAGIARCSRHPNTP